jgi:aryl-alcohol dehydrogenase-like predicted oxidoreductase
MSDQSQKDRFRIFLGTAMWAWTIDKKRAFQLLDEFYELGYRDIDSATNYPINKQAEAFLAAENYIADWVKRSGVKDLRINMKVGSLSNDGSPENDLSPKFLAHKFQEYKNKFETNMTGFMIHWDNRNDEVSIKESLNYLRSIDNNIEIGLSGIKHPDIYAKCLRDWVKPLYIQCKSNLLNSSLDHFSPLNSKASYICYGLNAGGIKLDSNYSSSSSATNRGVKEEPFSEQIQKLKEKLPAWEKRWGEKLSLGSLSLAALKNNPKVKGVVLGPSSTEQLKSSLKDIENISSAESSWLSEELNSL